MVILARAGGFKYCDPYHNLSEKLSPGFFYYNQTNARVFVNHDQADGHKCMIGSPGRAIIGYPANKIFNASTKYFSFLPEF